MTLKILTLFLVCGISIFVNKYGKKLLVWVQKMKTNTQWDTS